MTARVLVAGWIGSTNLGDELVFGALVRKLAAHGVEPTAISLAPAATRREHGVAALSHRDVAGILAAAGRADGLVLGGGGLLQDETSPLNLPYHLARVWAARVRATPFVAVGVGAGRLDTAPGRALVRASLRTARAVCVRDEPSRALLTQVGVPAVRVAADLALSLPAPAGAGEPDRLVVCLRPWTGRRGRLPAAARGDATPQAFVDAAAAALDRLADTGWRIRFVAFQRDRDHRLHERVAAAMRAPATTATPDVADVADEVAAGRVVVSVRYHGGVAAALAGRPVVLVGYSPKVAALAADLGAGARLLPWSTGALADLPEAVGAVLDRGDDVVRARERLRRRERLNDDALRALLGAAVEREA